MKRHHLISKVLTVLLAAAAMGGAVSAAEPDLAPPVITHTPVSTAYSDANLIIKAKVADASAVQRVNLLFRTQGTTNFYSINMARVGSEYRAAIPASYMTPGSVEYYIQATDAAGNIATYPAEGSPQTVSVRKDTTVPEPELVEPSGAVSAGGFAVYVVFRDLAGNVDPKSVRVFYNGREVTADTMISNTGFSYNVPASDVTLHPQLIVEAADLAGNRVKRSFSFWKSPDWSRELRVDYQPGEDAKAKLDMSMGWGPLYLSANLRSNDPWFTGDAGQPENSFELRYDARLMRLAVGDTTSSVAPLALDALRHRGGDLTLRLGPISLQSVYGFPSVYVAGEEYQRKLIAVKPAFDTRGLDFSLSLVKIRDEWTPENDIPGVNPELNYVLDGQVGLAMLGGKAGLDIETALSIYHDNARGDLWTTLDAVEDEELQEQLRKIPDNVKDFLEMPDLQYGFPKIDVGAQATLRLPLPWSQAQAQYFRYGKSFYTIAGSGEGNAEGLRATYDTIRLLNALQLSTECERKIDNVTPLLDLAMENELGNRTVYNTCTAKVSMGPAGRLNLDLGATYSDEAPLDGELTEITNGYTAELRNVRFRMFGAGVRLGASAGLTQYNDLTEASGLNDKDTQVYKVSGGLDVGAWSYDVAYGEKREVDAVDQLMVRNPSIDGSITWTLRKPHLLFFTPQDLRLRLSGSSDRSLDRQGVQVSAKNSVKFEADSRLTQAIRLSGAWQQVRQQDTAPETKWSTSFRWRF